MDPHPVTAKAQLTNWAPQLVQQHSFSCCNCGGSYSILVDHVEGPTCRRQRRRWRAGPICQVGNDEGVLWQQGADQWVRAQTVNGCSRAKSRDQRTQLKDPLHSCKYQLSLIYGVYHDQQWNVLELQVSNSN